MRKRISINPDVQLLVDVEALQQITSLGKQSAERIAADAGAVIRVGRRKLYSVEALRDYIKSMSVSEE